jgi:hypothetical protein
MQIEIQRAIIICSCITVVTCANNLMRERAATNLLFHLRYKRVRVATVSFTLSARLASPLGSSKKPFNVNLVVQHVESISHPLTTKIHLLRPLRRLLHPLITIMSATSSNTIGNSFLETKRKVTTLSSTTLLSLPVEDVN